MRFIRCDVLSCAKEIAGLDVKFAELNKKQYELCSTCYESLEKFIKENLSGGIDALSEILKKWEKPQISTYDPQKIMLSGQTSGTPWPAEGAQMTFSFPETHKGYPSPLHTVKITDSNQVYGILDPK